MRGRYRVRITDKKLQYDFTINRKFTVIRGDSATGKTTLYDLLVTAQTYPWVQVSCQAECIPGILVRRNWDFELRNQHDKIFFFDEDDHFINDGDFAEAAMHSDNYFVLINREPMHSIPYSVKEIYEVKRSGSMHFLKPLYEDDHTPIQPTCIVTEDRRSGYIFFRKLLEGKAGFCIAASGKSNIYKILRSDAVKGEDVLVLADEAAFGSEIKRVLFGSKLKEYKYHKLRLFLPESFEWLLLHERLFRNDQTVQNVLENPAEVVDTTYNSWEQFFYQVLRDATEGTPARYHKERLGRCYYEPCCTLGSPCRLQIRSSINKAEDVLRLFDNVDFSRMLQDKPDSEAERSES